MASDPHLTVENGKSSVATMKAEAEKLKKTKAQAADLATIKDAQKKVEALVAELSPAVADLEKTLKELDDWQKKKTELQTKVAAFNAKRANIKAAGKAAFEFLNTARGKGTKEDQAALARLFSVTALYKDGVSEVTL
jgi:uncharacterized coiled-coil DUF342 family protein